MLLDKIKRFKVLFKCQERGGKELSIKRSV